MIRTKYPTFAHEYHRPYWSAWADSFLPFDLTIANTMHRKYCPAVLAGERCIASKSHIYRSDPNERDQCYCQLINCLADHQQIWRGSWRDALVLTYHVYPGTLAAHRDALARIITLGNFPVNVYESGVTFYGQWFQQAGVDMRPGAPMLIEIFAPGTPQDIVNRTWFLAPGIPAVRMTSW